LKSPFRQGDNHKRSSRAADFQKEAETTRQLNQRVASAGGLPKTR